MVGARLANLKDGQTKPGASIEAPVTQMGEGRPKKTASIEAVFTQDEAAKLLNVHRESVNLVPIGRRLANLAHGQKKADAQICASVTRG